MLAHTILITTLAQVATCIPLAVDPACTDGTLVNTPSNSPIQNCISALTPRDATSQNSAGVAGSVSGFIGPFGVAHATFPGWRPPPR
ncbi:hypothetical protein BD779DRAFT_995338 [Infundibulicybe gibba]|nr:hypothetical protein BD779DRAFT_995338 [Infundibulicybe gibba]